MSTDNPMPRVLLVLIACVAMNLGLSVLAATFVGGWLFWLGPVVNGAILVGVLRGNDPGAGYLDSRRTAKRTEHGSLGH